MLGIFLSWDSVCESYRWQTKYWDCSWGRVSLKPSQTPENGLCREVSWFSPLSLESGNRYAILSTKEGMAQGGERPGMVLWGCGPWCFCKTFVGCSENWGICSGTSKPSFEGDEPFPLLSLSEPRIYLRGLDSSMSLISDPDSRPDNVWCLIIMGPGKALRSGPTSHSSHTSPYSPFTWSLKIISWSLWPLYSLDTSSSFPTFQMLLLLSRTLSILCNLVDSSVLSVFTLNIISSRKPSLTCKLGQSVLPPSLADAPFVHCVFRDSLLW